MNIEFVFENEDYKFDNIDLIKKWIFESVKLEGKIVGEISYTFVSNKRILELNRDFLNHDYFTDIITFDESFINIINGGIFISWETVKSNAEIYQVSFNQELNRVIIHGIMHLCGYDDHSLEEKSQMRDLENKYLSYLEKL